MGMADTKILQAILNKVSSLESSLKLLEKKMEAGFNDVGERFDRVDKRIDNLGLQISELEDDAPTNEEFGLLEKRVKKLEKVVLSV